MVEVIVEHNYIAKEPDELTIKKGDIIQDVIKKPGGWWEGVLKDKRGMFPDNFVRPLDTGVTFRNKKDVNRIRQCRVIFSYQQDHEDELNLNVGDVINILGTEEEGWWRGILNGKEGVFPSNFVEEITPPVSFSSKSNSRECLAPGWIDQVSEAPTVPPKPMKAICQVKYSYKAENDDELTLNEGDLVTLISKDGQDPGWWKGELKGKIGVFPDNFVVVLTPEELNHLQKREEYSSQQKKETEVPKKPSEEEVKQLNASRNSENLEDNEISAKVTPPIPSKKPSISLKKSPSGSGSQGLFSGLRKKLVDVVDGATSSKSSSSKSPDNKDPPKPVQPNENAFDQVGRTSILQDVRATRAKAPGRRPPTVLVKEGEPGVTNGFGAEHSAPIDIITDNNNINEGIDGTPRLRDQFKVPWLEEMKLNQAKRSSTSPKQDHDKINRGSTPPETEEKTDKPEKESDVSKSKKEVPTTIEAPSKPKVKPKLYPDIDSVVTRKLAPVTPRPQTIHTVPEPRPSKLTPSPILSKVSPSKPRPEDRVSNENISKVHPLKPRVEDRTFNDTGVVKMTNPKPQAVEDDRCSSDVDRSPPESSFRHSGGDRVSVDRLSGNYGKGSGDHAGVINDDVTYAELLKRVKVLEKQNAENQAAIEELKAKLQLETDMRIMLQAELEKVKDNLMLV